MGLIPISCRGELLLNLDVSMQSEFYLLQFLFFPIFLSKFRSFPSSCFKVCVFHSTCSFNRLSSCLQACPFRSSCSEALPLSLEGETLRKPSSPQNSGVERRVYFETPFSNDLKAKSEGSAFTEFLDECNFPCHGPKLRYILKIA